MTELEQRIDIRELTRLWKERCDCGGPQPGLANARTEDHHTQCLYAVAVETDRSFQEVKRG
jgi:hypothetical protein